MRVLDGEIGGWERPSSSTSVTLGVFDGVHLGHRRLIDATKGREGIPAVITFEPHPVEVLIPGTDPRLITSIEERLQLLESAGVELVAVLDLSEVRYLSPQEFIDEVLVGKLNVSSMVVGEDFRFGRDRSGDVRFLRSAGERAGFATEAVQLVASGDEPVSSSRIRIMIESGDLATASQLLGSNYRLTNTVINGDKRGRQIGFPTANLLPPARKVIPADGVYATISRWQGKEYMSATNVGTRPTFGGGQRLVEAFLLDFDEDLYEQQLQVEFVKRLRPELAFDDVDALVSQMQRDVEQSRGILSSVMG